MDFYKSQIPIIDTDGHDTTLSHPTGAVFGAVPRDYISDPPRVGAAPSELELIPESEWDARFDEQETTESSLEHLYLRGGKPAFTNLDQNGDGHCWCYSTGHAIMLARLRDHLPLVRINPHFIATYLRRFDGGWCGASMGVAARIGCAPEGNGPDEWPLHSNDTRLLTELRMARAGNFLVTENWYDTGRQVWDQQLTSKQLATLAFSNIPAPSDFNWWGHSVCQVRWVRIERGSWGPLILNSWKGWGQFGLAVLRGSQAIADGAVAVRATVPTA